MRDARSEDLRGGGKREGGEVNQTADGRLFRDARDVASLLD